MEKSTATIGEEGRREETPNERAQRILMMCNMVEESRERVKKAEMVTTEEEMTVVGSDGEDESESVAGGDNDDVSIAYSHMSVSDLGYDQLKEKLRQCQLTILKVQENSTLKYQRLQVEHRQLKESLITLQSEYKFVHGKNKLFSEERDAATKNAELVAKTRDEMMEKVTNENDDLRKQVDSMIYINKRLMKQRDEFRCQLDGCTCQAIELDDMSTSFRSNNMKKTGGSRRGLFGRPQPPRSNYSEEHDEDEDEDHHLRNTSKPRIIMTRGGVDDAATESTTFSGSFRSLRSEYTTTTRQQRPNNRKNIFANIWKHTRNSFQAEECNGSNNNINNNNTSNRSLFGYDDTKSQRSSTRRFQTTKTNTNDEYSSTSRSRRWS